MRDEWAILVIEGWTQRGSYLREMVRTGQRGYLEALTRGIETHIDAM